MKPIVEIKDLKECITPEFKVGDIVEYKEKCGRKKVTIVIGEGSYSGGFKGMVLKDDFGDTEYGHISDSFGRSSFDKFEGEIVIKV